MARFERTEEFAKQRVVSTKLTPFNIGHHRGFNLDSDAPRLKKGGGTYTPKACDIKSTTRCAIQLRFKAGRPIIRACDGKEAFDFPARDPVEGQNIAAELCKCKAKTGSFAACLEKATARALACTKDTSQPGCFPGYKLRPAEEHVSLPQPGREEPKRLTGSRRKLGAVYDLSKTTACSPAAARAAKNRAWAAFMAGEITQDKHNEIVSRANALCPKKKKRKR